MIANSHAQNTAKYRRGCPSFPPPLLPKAVVAHPPRLACGVAPNDTPPVSTAFSLFPVFWRVLGRGEYPPLPGNQHRMTFLGRQWMGCLSGGGGAGSAPGSMQQRLASASHGQGCVRAPIFLKFLLAWGGWMGSCPPQAPPPPRGRCSGFPRGAHQTIFFTFSRVFFYLKVF